MVNENFVRKPVSIIKPVMNLQMLATAKYGQVLNIMLDVL